MGTKRYNLHYVGTEDMYMGEEVFRLLDSARKRNQLIYDILAGLITRLDIGDLPGNEMVKRINEWSHKAGEEHPVRKTAAAPKIPTEEAGNVPLNGNEKLFDLSPYVKGAKYSKLTGGEG